MFEPFLPSLLAPQKVSRLPTSLFECNMNTILEGNIPPPQTSLHTTKFFTFSDSFQAQSNLGRDIQTFQMLNLLGLIFASPSVCGVSVSASAWRDGSFPRNVPPVPCSQELRKEVGKCAWPQDILSLRRAFAKVHFLTSGQCKET